MTDTAGAPPEPTAPAGHRPRWPRWAALGSSLVLLAAAGTGWWLYRKLDANITTDAAAAAELERHERERPAPVPRGGRKILLIGSDSRAGENAEYGRDQGTQRSDTTILLHLSARGHGVTAVSIPRDLMVRVPACRTRAGERSAPRYTQFNLAFQLGGTACTIRTLEKLTGVRVGPPRGGDK
ncbi:LCP family protein, partial [Streptomyces sp. Act-28]